MNKLIIFSAPSGAGKTSILQEVLKHDLNIEFSISATSRPRRKGERNGRDYHFLTTEEFLEKIKNKEFLEWEEVYRGSYYGTLKSEVQRIQQKNKHVIFDVDVKGGRKIKEFYGSQALAIFIMPPSIQELEHRLRRRGSENEESLRKRLARVQEEMLYADDFDKIIVNENLQDAIDKTYHTIVRFTSKQGTRK